MKILVLGGDGYLGWPTAMHFSGLGDEVMVFDNFVKRRIELEEGVEPLEHVLPIQRRAAIWKEQTGKDIEVVVGDLLNARIIYKVLGEFKPDAIIHYAEQPSAPYSMQSRERAVFTQHNNVIGNLNLMFAIQSCCPQTHLVKLGTMGGYGTPNIDIEEGWLDIEHNGRKDKVLFPKLPHSFYHLSKVHDTNNLHFACRIWGARVTDLNQGVVYGFDTDGTQKHPDLRTSFHYDDIFGTVLNRFCVQAVVGTPLTVYGSGGQTRGYLNIRDTLKCVELSTRNPADEGELRIYNQFTEQFSVMEIAYKIEQAGKRAGLDVKISHIENPRTEKEDHYYNAKHAKLEDLGLEPHLLTDEVLDNMIAHINRSIDTIDQGVFMPRVKWKS
jgi:UDP-sulfoquinovose synthase